ncbi:MAG: hypothetical protein ACTHMD_06115 [Flavisolibacter sp.]
MEPLPVEQIEDTTPPVEPAPGKERYGIGPGQFLFCFILGWLATVVICLFVRSMM